MRKTVSGGMALSPTGLRDGATSQRGPRALPLSAREVSAERTEGESLPGSPFFHS